MFDKGRPFMDVPEEAPIPDPGECRAAPAGVPVFSEAHLYPRLGKDDARFVLGVAEEYDRLISVLGPDTVRGLLDGSIEPRDVEAEA